MIDTTANNVVPIGRVSALRAEGRAEVKALKRNFAVQNWVGVGALFLVIIILPLLPGFHGWMATQASLIIVYVIAAQGLAILIGYTGLVSVGHGGFLASGAYTAALMTTHWGTDLLVGIIGAIVVSGFLGMLLSLVFLRLSGAFMAIGTLGFAFFVGAIVNNVPIFQGRTGILLPRNNILGFEIGDFGFYYVSVICLAFVTLFMFALMRSGTGRAFMALRDAEKAAQASGVNRFKYRMLAFTLSAAITGIAGALSAYTVRYVSAEVFGDIWYSVDILVAVVVGGSAMLLGPFIGGAFIVMVPFFFEELADFAFILKGLVLIGVLILAPAGVAGLIARPIQAWRRRRIERLAGSMGREVRRMAEAAEEGCA